MKVELIKQKIGDDVSYKYKSLKCCCKQFEKNMCINLTDEYPDNPELTLWHDKDEELPYLAICIDEIVHDWDDEYDIEHYYAIKFCPFCGEPIEVVVVGEEDKTEYYEKLKTKIEYYQTRERTTDSIREKEKCRSILNETNNLIDELFSLGEYKEVESEDSIENKKEQLG